VLGRPTQFDLAVRRHVELFLQKKGAVVAYLRTPWHVAAARVTQRGDALIHPSQLRRLSLEYNSIARRTLLPVMDVPEDFGPAQLEWLVTVAREAEKRVWPLDAFTTYVGPRAPKTLLLGEVRHEFRRDLTRPVAGVDPRSPAFGPFTATSGHYLLSNVKTVRDVGLANACDVDDWRALYSLLGRPKLVALGSRANRALHGVGHGAAPHPQYVRRFHHHAGTEYAGVIERASEGEDLAKWRP